MAKCVHWNLCILQDQLHTKHFYQLFRLSFIFTAVTLIKMVLFPVGALLVMSVSVRYLDSRSVVFFFAAALLIYLKLIDPSVERFI